MGKRLYVGNLNYSTTADILRTAFEQDGRKVSDVHIVMDRETGRSRGFAFVEMSTDAEAQAAVTAMNGAKVDGRALKVNEAREREGGGGGGGGFHRGGGGGGHHGGGGGDRGGHYGGGGGGGRRGGW